MKRVICSTFANNHNTIPRENLENAHAEAVEKYRSTGDGIYDSIADQIEDLLIQEKDEYFPSDFGALAKRFIDYCIDPSTDVAGHFSDDEEDLDISDDISVYSISDPFGEMVGNNKQFRPGQEGQAIQYWFKESEKYPTCTAIMGDQKSADAIREFAVNNEGQIREWAARYRCPYKIDWLLKECAKPHSQSSRYADQIYPFSLG